MQFKKLPGGPGLPDFPEFSYLKVFYNFLERSGQTTAELRTFSFRDTAELSIYWRQAIADVIEFIDITKFIIMENKEKKDAPAKKENQKKTSPKNTEGTPRKRPRPLRLQNRITAMKARNSASSSSMS